MRRGFSLLLLSVLLAFVVLGFRIDDLLRRHQSTTARAEWLTKSGRYAEAEALYWQAIERGPVTVPLVVAFLDVHPAKDEASTREPSEAAPHVIGEEHVRVREPAIDALFERPD